MRRLLLFYLIIQVVRSSCPEGFELVSSGQCRELEPIFSQSSADPSTVDTAMSKCKEKDAQPVIIHNDEEQEYWEKKYKYYIPLGLVCNTTSKRWQWVDGSAADYTPPEGTFNAELTDDCMEGCTWFIWTAHNSNNGDWFLYCSNSHNYEVDIYCITQLQQPVLPAEGCYEFEVDSDNNMCYQIGEAAETWSDAHLSCEKVGSNLVSVHNSNENSFIRRLAVSDGAVHGVFLGAALVGKGEDYGWIDGSAWDYENFYPGFPISGFGDCIVLDTSVSSGQWVNNNCAAKLPVACARERKTVDWNPTCNIQTWEEGSLITSPGFPFNASIPCDYYLKVDEGKKVEVEIALLEANSCCDYMTLYDGFFGGYVIANLTGAMENVTYKTSDSNVMKVSWMPNGGVNVKGMALTFRGV